MSGTRTSTDERVAIEYFKDLEKQNLASANDKYSIMLSVDVTFSKSGNSRQGYQLVKYSNSDDAKPIRWTEEDFRERYPLDYKELTALLREKLPKFKQNEKYHSIRAKYEKDPALSGVRYLNPDKSKGIPHKRYNHNIVQRIIDDWKSK